MGLGVGLARGVMADGNLSAKNTTRMVALDVSTYARQKVSPVEKRASSAARAQADQLFERTWRKAYPALRSRALRLAGGQPDRTDELLAGAAIKALQFMRRSPQRLTDPELFLFVVLRHVFLDSVRRRLRDDRLFDCSIEIDDTGSADAGSVRMTEQWNEHREQLQLVTAALQTMPRELQRLFVLRFIDELPYSVIAERLGINEPLARKRVQLLRARLIVALEHDRLHEPAPAAFQLEHAA